MGVLVYTTCKKCGRSGSANEETNYIYECSTCENFRINKEIKNSTNQVWWIRLLYWLIGKKQLSYNKNNCKILLEELIK